MAQYKELEDSGFGRVDRDAWFTPRETSQKIVDFLLKEYPEWKDLEWVEPSAGDGSFIDACKNRGISVTGYDLEPQREDIIKADFLNFNKDLFSDRLDLTGKIVIGNPPYGVRNKLTIEFINHAFGLGADKVVFLLLSNMMSVSYLKKINRKIDLVKFIDTDFIDGGADNRTLGGVGANPMFVVFDKEKEEVDWKELSNGPYCRIIYHRDDIKEDYVIVGYNHFGLVVDLVDEIKTYRNSNEYKIGRKIYLIYDFYDKDLLNSEKEFLYNLYSMINLSWKISSSTINFWLTPENRAKVDFEHL